MGFDEPCFRDTDEDLVDQALDSDHPHMRGITRERLMAEGFVRLNVSAPGTPYVSYADGIFPTPSGKIELFSETLERMGLDPLPTHTPLAESADGSPELHAKYPLALLTPSTHHFLNTTFGNVPSLIRKEGTPFIELNCGRCRRARHRPRRSRPRLQRPGRDLRDRVSSVRRRAPASPSPPRSGGTGQHKKRSGINALTSQRTADMGGGATFYTNLVQVELPTP